MALQPRFLSARANGSRRLGCAALLAIALLVGLAQALDLPALTGRVVDQANVIPAPNRSAIEGKLKELEDKSGIQLVVATVNSLQGSDVETFANELFRHWKLGELKKNNGLLLLVAPKERKVRIEVGYGLEGTLTDALSNIIITGAIVPRFKANDYAGGIERGVDDIITVLTTDASEWQKRPSLRLDSHETRDPVSWLLVAGLIALVTLLIVSPGFRWFFLNVVLNILLNSGGSRGGGSFGGSSSGGGFSGGGGSSGGA